MFARVLVFVSLAFVLRVPASAQDQPKAIVDTVTSFTVNPETHGRPHVLILDAAKKHIWLHWWKRTGEEDKAIEGVSIVELETGAVVDTLLEEEFVEDSAAMPPLRPGWLDATPDLKVLVFTHSGGKRVTVLDSSTGERLAEISPPDGFKQVKFIRCSENGKTITAFLDEPPGIARWRLPDGELLVQHAIKEPQDIKPYHVAFVSNDERLLVLGTAVEENEYPLKTTALIYDPNTETVVARRDFDGSVEFLSPTAETGELVVVRRDDPSTHEFTGFERYAVPSFEKIDEVRFPRSVTFVQTAWSPSLDRLYLLEYLVQPLYVFDWQEKRFTTVIAPERGAIHCFGVAADESVVVAAYGPWRDGVAKPEKIGLIDLNDPGIEAPDANRAPTRPR